MNNCSSVPVELSLNKHCTTSIVRPSLNSPLFREIVFYHCFHLLNSSLFNVIETRILNPFSVKLLRCNTIRYKLPLSLVLIHYFP